MVPWVRASSQTACQGLRDKIIGAPTPVTLQPLFLLCLVSAHLCTDTASRKLTEELEGAVPTRTK